MRTEGVNYLERCEQVRYCLLQLLQHIALLKFHLQVPDSFSSGWAVYLGEGWGWG